MSSDAKAESPAVAAQPVVAPAIAPAAGETITQIEGGAKPASASASAEKLPTIEEENPAGEEKKKVPAGQKIKAIINKVKTLLACVKISKREKPAKEGAEGEETKEEGLVAEDKKEGAASVAEEKKDEEPKKEESVAPTLPPVASTATPAEETKA